MFAFQRKLKKTTKRHFLITCFFFFVGGGARNHFSLNFCHCFGCGSNAAWICGSDVVRTWFGRGSDVGSDVVRTRLGRFFGSGESGRS